MSDNIRYDNDQRLVAAREGKALFTVEVNGRTAKKASMTYQGPMDAELANKLTAFCVIAAEESPQEAWRQIFGKPDKYRKAKP